MEKRTFNDHLKEKNGEGGGDFGDQQIGLIESPQNSYIKE